MGDTAHGHDDPIRHFAAWAKLLDGPVLLVDDAGAIVAADDSAVRVVDDGPLIGRALRDLVDDDDTRVDDLVASCRTSTSRVPGRLTMRGESYRVNAVALSPNGPVAIRIIESDDQRARFRALTETVHRLEEEVLRRRRAEQDLSARTKLLRTVIDNAPASIYVKDRRGRYVEANRMCARNHGVHGPEEIVGRTDHDLFPPAQARFVREVDRSVMDQGTPRTLEEHLTSGGGTFTFLTLKVPLTDADGRVYGLVGVSTDITDRAEADALLRQRTEQLGVAQRIARLASWRLDPVTEVVETSPEMDEMLGLEPGAAHSVDSIAALTHPDDVAIAADEVELVRAAAAIDSVSKVERPDGSVIWVRLRTDGIPGDDGWLVGTVQDVTEEVLAERRRAELELRVRRTERLESIGQLAGGVAHDFNNLLSVAKLHSELAREVVAALGSSGGPAGPDRAVSEELRDHLTQAELAIDRATDLTRRLLQFGRLDETDPHRVDVNAAIAELLVLLQRTLGAHIELVHHEHPVPAIEVDPTQLDQVLVNLAVNARDAMPDGGRLTIATDVIELDDAAAAADPDLRPGRVVRITVTDTGRGMPPEVVERAFEPFFTTRADRGGTGLGLATVHGIVTGASGAVHVHSELGRGTVVTLHFPAATVGAAATPASRPEASDPAIDDRPDRGTVSVSSMTEHTDDRADGANRTGTGGPASGAMILVVEDQHRLARLVARLLERRGHVVVVAHDGNEALDLLEPDGPIDDLDLVLTDVIMPSMSGGQLAVLLAQRRPEVPVVFMSGFAGADDPDGPAQEADRNGTMLHKPFTGAELIEFVDAALARGQRSSG